MLATLHSTELKARSRVPVRLMPIWMPEMPRWMFAFPIVLLLMAALIVFAFTRTGPTDNQNTHAPQTGQTR